MYMKLVCWNVNGIRAAYRKGLLDWIHKESPDILCLQETKASGEQLPDDLRDIPGFESFFTSSEDRAGYSGVALYSKTHPIKVDRGIGIDKFDREGRTMIAHYPDFVLCNIYFPNGKASPERLQFKMDYYEEFLRYVNDLRSKGRSVIICGDINTAHHEIDIARPKDNMNRSGFLPEERAWMDRLVENGFVDTFRKQHPVEIKWSWWDQKTRARERNVGWRIDYFFVSGDLMPRVTRSFIEDEVMGSDHCPVGIEML
jgi:exodeoxyribonuclease-3